MKIVLVGHRGVGKTSLLQRLHIYTQMLKLDVPVFDLDREIEKSVGAKVGDIFSLIGEKSFREMERTIFRHLAFHPRYVIAVGAGFELDHGPFEEDVQVVWVRRRSDRLGRIFLDRPRLDPELNPLQEFQQRAQVREPLYAKVSHWIYELPEGLNSPNEQERHLFFGPPQEQGGVYTLHRPDFRKLPLLRERLQQNNFDFLEVRSDLVEAGDLSVLEQLPLAVVGVRGFLASARAHGRTETFFKFAQNCLHRDWAVELGPEPSDFHATIVSVHERRAEETLAQVCVRLAEAAGQRHEKLAIEIRSFAELEEGLNWQSEAPSKRSFLPRGAGRWRWVRQWLKGRQMLNFISSGWGDVSDQPSLMDWMITPEHNRSLPSYFAAVLGAPIDHSYSPAEQQSFFQHQQSVFLAVYLDLPDWETAMPLLQRMGLRWAAVTAPLKEKAFALAAEHTPAAQSLQSVNTLAYGQGHWTGHNTDLLGFQELCDSVELQEQIVIWGGGGTLPVVRAVLPKAIPYSVRAAAPRDSASVVDAAAVGTLIWAAGPEADLPPENLRPKLVIDLNYRDDARAKEYAQLIGARYVGGLMMFYEQARHQRQFWEEQNGSK